jgi:hypothetical protein
MPTNWAFWHTFNEEFIKACSKLLIVTLPGWQKSVGVSGEVAIAKKHKIPIEYIDPTLYIERIRGTKEN